MKRTFIIVMAMYRASFTIMGSYVASSFGVGKPPKVRSGPVDEGEEPPGNRCSFFTFSGCTDFFCETGTAFTSTFMLGTCTTSPYWSLVCTTTVAGHPQRMSSLFRMRAVFCGSAYESGCSHLDRKSQAYL